jgi:hypothetical protein
VTDLAFTVPGLAIPKSRPRLGKGRVYTPNRTSVWQRSVATYALRAMALAG